MGSVESDIALEQMHASNQMKDLNQQLEEAKEAVKYGNSVLDLAGMLKTFGESLESATTASLQETEQSKSAEELASMKMEHYLQQLRGYFLTEVQCIEELKSLVASNQSQLTSLKLELEQVSGLGMTTVTGQIETSIASKEKSVIGDSKRIVAFTNDATSMLANLVARLDAYTRLAKQAALGLQSVHVSLLIDIRSALTKLGATYGDRLNAFIPVSADNKPTVTTEFTATTAYSVATPPSSVPTPAPSEKSVPLLVGNAPATLPKLAWATSSKPAKSVPKPSLLDIQKEELESKK
jgi:hypothetical protein